LEVPPLLAIDSLGVGYQGSRLPNWTQSMESSRFIGVARDSIWMWQVSPKSNLAAGIEERRGGIYSSIVANGLPIRGGGVLYDGDAGTAFDPDEFPDLHRTTPIFIDLGATFRINRLRFFPRLDQTHQRRFLQNFQIFTSPVKISSDQFIPLLSFNAASPNAEPVVDKRFGSQEVRYLQLVPGANREWEIAELEVYGDGTLPLGEYVSVPLRVPAQRPVWGEVRVEGGDLSESALAVQTRTGPDAEPLHYFIRGGTGEEGLEQVSKAEYRELQIKIENKDSGTDPNLLGPTKPNPAWSPWEATSEGGVVSPDLQKYLQFRVLLSAPGTSVGKLVIEYAQPPLVEDLAAEIDPVIAPPGKEREFTLSMAVRLKSTGFAWERDTGFDQIQVRTAAQIHQVERVLVDDREIPFVATYERDRGMTLRLAQRVAQNGSFVQVVFRASLFLDHTRFEVRAVDRRQDEDRVDLAYQIARAANVEPGPPTGELVVKFDKEVGKVPFLADTTTRSRIFTPNGDGANDTFELEYVLLKLLEPVPVSVGVFDLSGRQLRQLYVGEEVVGQHVQVWDGRDERGALVPPGLYLYEVRVDADQHQERRQGVVGVVY
jgi:hypothetical protein